MSNKKYVVKAPNGDTVTLASFTGNYTFKHGTELDDDGLRKMFPEIILVNPKYKAEEVKPKTVKAEETKKEVEKPVEKKEEEKSEEEQSSDSEEQTNKPEENVNENKEVEKQKAAPKAKK